MTKIISKLKDKEHKSNMLHDNASEHDTHTRIINSNINHITDVNHKTKDV